MLAQLVPFSLAIGGSFFLWFTAFWLFASIFWLWMLVDCLTKKRLPDTEKLIWVVVLLFTHILGAILYFVLVRSRGSGGNLPPAAS